MIRLRRAALLTFGLALACGGGGDPDAGVDAAAPIDAGDFDDVEWPTLSEAERSAALEPREGRVEVVLDTDLGNEIDDQFAVVHALLAPERLHVRAIHTAPWGFSPELFASPYFTSALDARLLREQLARNGLTLENLPTVVPASGESAAFAEAAEVLAATARDDVPIHRGSRRYLFTAPRRPVESAAVESLVALGREPRDGPLYVVCLGALTNVASALLAAPDLAARVVVVWTSTYPSFWPHVNASFNLAQDVEAARVVFESGVPLVYVPGFFVAEEIRVTRPEIQAHLAGAGPAATFLRELFEGYPLDGDHYAGRSKVIWDLAAVGWVLEPSWYESALVPTPTLDEELRWSARAGAPVMREALDLSRDGLIRDFFARVAATDP